jgi:hypothetical protein
MLQIFIVHQNTGNAVEAVEIAMLLQTCKDLKIFYMLQLEIMIPHYNLKP